MDTVYGRPIEEETESGIKVPLILDRCTAWFEANPAALQAEGVFRVSPEKADLDFYSSAIALDESAKIPASTPGPVVAGMYKQYFKALPEPVFTFAAYESFIKAQNSPEDLSIARSALPIGHQLVVENLIEMLRRVVTLSEFNRMDTEAICNVFGMAISSAEGANADQVMRWSQHTPSILKTLMTIP